VDQVLLKDLEEKIVVVEEEVKMEDMIEMMMIEVDMEEVPVESVEETVDIQNTKTVHLELEDLAEMV